MSAINSFEEDYAKAAAAGVEISQMLKNLDGHEAVARYMIRWQWPQRHQLSAGPQTRTAIRKAIADLRETRAYRARLASPDFTPPEPPSFPAFMERRIGRNWCVAARKTKRLREQYDRILKPKEYRALETEYAKLFPHTPAGQEIVRRHAA